MEGTLGMVKPWAPTFAPRGWAFCWGQLLPIAQFQALFSLLGTIYGGDGRTTFALPDLRGRVVVGQGQGPGLSSYQLGRRGGQSNVTLADAEMASHDHTVTITPTFPATTAAADQHLPGPMNSLATPTIQGRTGLPLYSTQENTEIEGAVLIGDLQLSPTGGGQAHESRQPFLALHYIICLEGIYPSRS
jgi:microcystin-dependent protein